ncbi:MAG: peptidoglycan DD-metalloendopeptidase family protein [Anaerolineae bacterium]|nr:peptidoglycan DD-metalloendopeptidase family protein [Anaerolineae bacterium]MBT7074015.1 peptidoglycan DD-metalloendopeptidase family protein [Anaerolineae bacterium]MBT7782026.1 peptidoglycan DD-metalloendopeptidase family protein [Anaerolineae bacterium]
MKKNPHQAFAFILGVALTLTACSAATSPNVEGNPTLTPQASIQTAASLPAEVAPLPVAATATKIAPLRFTIPTPGAEPRSDWRPPLYPVPWAISPHDHFYFIRPIAADQIDWGVANYRYGGMLFANIVHSGIDIPTDEGVPILAAGGGTVTWASWGLFSGESTNQDDPYGQAVAIKHDFGYEGESLYTIYAHMSHIDVTRGQWVAAGEQLGLVGDTGHTTGPHLHFEIRLGRNDFLATYNPELWVVPPQGWGVLTGRVMANDGSLLRGYQTRVISYETGYTYKVSSYGPKVINSDPYYQENLVLSDLLPGWYELRITYIEDDFTKEFQEQIQIFPGQISYFSFEGLDGFNLELPKDDGMRAWTPTPEED